MADITRHDLQDLRRRVRLDQRAVIEGDLDGVDVLDGVIEHVTNLLDKIDGPRTVSLRQAFGLLAEVEARLGSDND